MPLLVFFTNEIDNNSLRNLLHNFFTKQHSLLISEASLFYQCILPYQYFL